MSELFELTKTCVAVQSGLGQRRWLDRRGRGIYLILALTLRREGEQSTNLLFQCLWLGRGSMSALEVALLEARMV
jgi:predicted transcriptional regulator of viral defense system